MNAFLSTAVISLTLAASAHAGTIIGTVRAESKPGADAGDTGGKYDSRKFKYVERVNYSELRDFVVCIEGAVTNAPQTPDKLVVVETRRVSQQGASFSPHVLPVTKGTVVEWPNRDDIFHNVFSMSEAKPFDLDLYKGNPPEKRVTFDQTGRVDVFCSIHANMHCIVLVLENPFFAVVNDQGGYSIPHVPPGTYRLKAWHERLPAQVKEITVPETGEVKIDFVLGINNLPKY